MRKKLQSNAGITKSSRSLRRDDEPGLLQA